MSVELATPLRPRVAVVASEGVPIFELAIAIEVFGTDRRDLTPEWYEFELVGADADTRLAHGVGIRSTSDLSALETVDTVVVPACTSIHEKAPAAVVDAVRQAYERGARVAAICSGAFVLAQAGLLDGRRATTHWMHAEELARRYPATRVDPNVLYVHDGVWTSAGSSAGLDMGLQLVREDFGAAVANEVARRVVAPVHRDGGQAQYIRPGVRTKIDDASGVQAWARDHIADATVSTMAAHAAMSQRTLNRRFRELTGSSPQMWLQRLRLDVAAELLESSNLTVEAIARRTGLGTAANLRTRFAKMYGVPPTHYRGTFAGRDRQEQVS